MIDIQPIIDFLNFLNTIPSIQPYIGIAMETLAIILGAIKGIEYLVEIYAKMTKKKDIEKDLEEAKKKYQQSFDLFYSVSNAIKKENKKIL